MAISITSAAPKQTSLARNWLEMSKARVERALEEIIRIPDERGMGDRWLEAWLNTVEYTLRPAKRLRPSLVLIGYGLAGGGDTPAGIIRFAAATELLHTFLLIHDDVADRAQVRRGGRALHELLGGKKRGEDLAVVVGDHLFARSLEVMHETGLPTAPRAIRYFLAVCRHTAVGQYLDIDLSGAPLRKVSLGQTLQVADLKTARYGFVAPLVCGAMLADASEGLISTLGRVGKSVGIAFQLQDDLLGLFGDPKLSGKSASSDVEEGKRTFPVVAAYLRGNSFERHELEKLFTLGAKSERQLERARELVRKLGGLDVTERLIARHVKAARRALAEVPTTGGYRGVLEALLQQLAGRTA